ENAGIFEKEVALFGEEEIEACQVHLLLIDLDLREIRAVCAVERERRCDTVFEVHTTVVVGVCLCCAIYGAGLSETRRGERFYFQVAPLMYALEPLQRAGLRNSGHAESNGDRRPETLFVSADDEAAEVHAPLLRGLFCETQCLEWNHEFGDPAFLVDGDLDVPGSFPIVI